MHICENLHVENLSSLTRQLDDFLLHGVYFKEAFI